jgi:hypothetical protein
MDACAVAPGIPHSKERECERQYGFEVGITFAQVDPYFLHPERAERRTTMTESAFKKVFTEFLNTYWGAFHEVLEAQSVTPRRLAGSLFDALRAEHRAFEEIYVGPAKSALDGLDQIWRDVQARRYQWPDPPLTRDEVTKALQLFGEIYSSLVHQGQRYPAACKEILKHAPHRTPKEPLRADAAR